MTFEDELRSTLHAQAGDLDLRGRGATEVMHLARRRQHRARRAGAVAAVGVLGIGTVGAIAARRTDGVAVTSVADQVGLPDIGPLELSWQTSPGGVVGGVAGEARFAEDGGALYALSTAPGARYPDDGSPMAPAVYRLADDGTWVPAGAVGAVPMADLAVDGSSLYAIGTAPAAGAPGYDAVLSSSSDGGATWSTAATAPVAPPSAVVAWRAASSVAIERAPGATAAIVTTSFWPAQSVIDQAAARAGAETNLDYGVEPTDAGFDIVSYLGSEPSAGTTMVLPTVPPTGADEVGAPLPAPAGSVPAATVAPDGSAGGAGADPATRDEREPARTVVATIGWADLGITGADALTTSEVLIEHGGSWTPVAAPELAGLSVGRLTVAGQDLVLEAWDDAGPRTLASTDGTTWHEVGVGPDSRLVGLGNAWVDVPWKNGDGSPVVRGSVDRGASWATVDLGAVDGRLASTAIVSVDSGPLGLAAVAVSYDEQSGTPTSYLVTTRDLRTWTVTPLGDITGGNSAAASVHVGADRIVVTATDAGAGDGAAAASVTAIGTPVR